jgi:hypothetical protein
MTDADAGPASRSEFHRQHQAHAVAEAERMLAKREGAERRLVELGGG